MSAAEPLTLDLAVAAEITAQLDAPFVARRLRRFENVSADVFEIEGDGGRAAILKAYADEPAWKLRKEAFVAGLFAPVAEVPRWLAVDESRARLPRRFVVMTRLPGVSVRDRFGRAGAPALFRKMGALLRRLHDVKMPRHGYLLEADVAEPFETNATRMAAAFETKYRDFRDWGGDPGLCQRIERFVAARAQALAECDGAVLCHNDFHTGNVLAAPKPDQAPDLGPDGGWRLSGLVDFENAVAGDPLFDLAKALDYTAHECPSGRAPLAEGYGPLGRPGAEEALAVYRVYHKLELLNWFKAVGEGRFGPATASLVAELAKMTAAG
jgi:aminoglycoside phosphotransferase (APT) family kinase protein